ncbi:hypothetical protein LguiB_026984 [Lonicera macranthoides]
MLTKTRIPLSTSSLVPTHEQIAHLILEQKSPTQALQTFRWATTNLPTFTPNQSTYRALVHKLCTFRHFDIVHQLLDEMLGSIGSPLDEDIFITIVRGLGRARMIRQVVKVLDLVAKFGKNPSLKLLNSILDVLVKEGIDKAREFYRKKMMGCGVQGDCYTFGILMKGLCLTNRIGDGFRLLQVMKNRGVTPNTVIYNTLIHALCKNGKVGRARSLMNEIVQPNEVTFNVMVSAYCREENLVLALVMLEKSFNLGFVPDVVILTKVVEILCKEGRAMEVVEILARVGSKGGRIDVVAYNTLIMGFCKLEKTKVGYRFLKEMEIKGCIPNVDTGRMEDGFKILDLMEERKGGFGGRVSPYNSILYGLYKDNRWDEALQYLTRMGNLFPKANVFEKHLS